jgi:hypothetical protein
MNDTVYQKLLEASWRRPLTPEEQARLQALLQAHPGLRADWETETALSQALGRLPEPALASNFTARVLRAAEAEQARRQLRPALAVWWEDWARALVPKAAWAAVALLLTATAIQQYRSLNRSLLARDLAKIPAVAALPRPEVLQDFEAIQQLRRVPAVVRSSSAISDEDLLAALQ